MKPTSKSLICTLALLLMLMGTVESSLAAQKLLAVPLRVQVQNQWCWAGTSSAVLSYYTKKINQCYLADFAWRRKDCCKTPGNCNSPNSMYGTPGSLQGIMNHWCVPSTAKASALTFAECQSELNGNRPFLIRYGWDGGGGHFIVGRGYKTDAPGYLYLMNPWPGTGYGIFTYSYVKRKVGDHTWTHTLKDIKRAFVPADWRITNTAPSYAGGYWKYTVNVNEFLNGCGKISSFYHDFWDDENHYLGRQNNTAADFPPWFDDCADKDIQLPRKTKFCGITYTALIIIPPNTCLLAWL
jgi:hypothetical protein